MPGTQGVDQQRAQELLSDPAFRAALDQLFDHVTVGRPVRDAAGAIVDFEMVLVNAPSHDAVGRTASEMEGHRVTELFPGWMASDVGRAFCRVVESGEPFVDHWTAYADTIDDGTSIEGYWSIGCAPFGDGYLAVSRDVSAVVREELARREEQRELERTRAAVELLQRSALPLELPVVDGLALAARHVPAGDDGQPVGGDWYDAFALGGGRVALVIGDVAGHGIDAAAHMVQLRTMVRTLAIEHEDPAAVLARANAVAARVGDRDIHTTCGCAVLDVAARTLRWASAGHLPMVRVGAEATLLEAPTGLPLGVDPDARYDAHEVALDRGDRIVAFTDGLVEARGEELGRSLERLRARLADAGPLSAPATVDALVAMRHAELDDLAVLCAELIGAQVP